MTRITVALASCMFLALVSENSAADTPNLFSSEMSSEAIFVGVEGCIETFKPPELASKNVKFSTCACLIDYYRAKRKQADKAQAQRCYDRAKAVYKGR